MRIVTTTPPSFPRCVPNQPLAAPVARWTVLCGDGEHWRVGIYSPPETSVEQIVELERHDCPELFLLISGRLSLLLAEAGQTRVLPLEPGKPVLVTAPHGGFCPDGPHTGRAFVVERDRFETEYKAVSEWREDKA